jgi:hypothetical protein
VTAILGELPTGETRIQSHLKLGTLGSDAFYDTPFAIGDSPTKGVLSIVAPAGFSVSQQRDPFGIDPHPCRTDQSISERACGRSCRLRFDAFDFRIDRNCGLEIISGCSAFFQALELHDVALPNGLDGSLNVGLVTDSRSCYLWGKRLVFGEDWRGYNECSEYLEKNTVIQSLRLVPRYRISLGNARVSEGESAVAERDFPAHG